MTSDTKFKECYNRILAIFLDYPEENREDFLALLDYYESVDSITGRTTSLSNKVTDLHDQLNFSSHVRIEALKHLIKIFDIKRKPTGLSGIYMSGSYSINPKIYGK